ncbi:MAG: family 1 glycosylhydrolase [Candidatus Woesearchaeota archaeon]
MPKFTFPEGFLWGTSLSTTQTEGCVTNDWSDVKALDGNKVGVACDHYNRYKEDFKLASDMHNNTIRVGIEWSRLQRSPYGQLESWAVNHYREYLGEARSLGLEPMVVLHHFANPLWFAEKGGWANRESHKIFADYTMKVANEFNDLTNMWNTFNEPSFYILNSYLAGIFPPFKKSLVKALKVKSNMKKAHKKAYNILKEKDKLVTATCAWRPCCGDGFFDNLAAKIGSYFTNDFFANAFMKHSDFFGLSYYGDTYIRKLKPILPALDYSQDYIEGLGLTCDDFNLLTPEGLVPALKTISKKYKKPIIIVENGFATKDESLREEMIIEHVRETGRAIMEGIDVKGYFYWSLLDNFEWNHGYTKNFGLFGVNKLTYKRIKRQAVDSYSQICKNNSIEL